MTLGKFEVQDKRPDENMDDFRLTKEPKASHSHDGCFKLYLKGKIFDRMTTILFPRM